jgi:hypothetical protein
MGSGAKEIMKTRDSHIERKGSDALKFPSHFFFSSSLSRDSLRIYMCIHFRYIPTLTCHSKCRKKIDGLHQ